MLFFNLISCTEKINFPCSTICRLVILGLLYLGKVIKIIKYYKKAIVPKYELNIDNVSTLSRELKRINEYQKKLVTRSPNFPDRRIRYGSLFFLN